MRKRTKIYTNLTKNLLKKLGISGNLLQLENMMIKEVKFDDNYTTFEFEKEVRIHKECAKHEIAPNIHAKKIINGYGYILVDKMDKTLQQFCPGMKKCISKKDYEAIKKIVEKMWSLGIIHNDLHFNNIMMKKVKNKNIWRIIDFDTAVQKNRTEFNNHNLNKIKLLGSRNERLVKGTQTNRLNTYQVSRELAGIEPINGHQLKLIELKINKNILPQSSPVKRPKHLPQVTYAWGQPKTKSKSRSNIKKSVSGRKTIKRNVGRRKTI
tara:strand:+ start:928 stop:1728 length:801 start_codon:yes stop_codon:yes gene_type:complete